MAETRAIPDGMGYEKSDGRSLVTEVTGSEAIPAMNRRTAVKAVVGLGLASALTDCTPASQTPAGGIAGP